MAAALLAGTALKPSPLIIHGQGQSAPQSRQFPMMPDAAGQSQVFYISASVSGLYPGSASTLNLSVQNPLGRPITVNTITVVAGSPSGTCPSSMLIVPPSFTLNQTYTINTSLYIPANSTVAGPSVTLSLDPTASNSCAGVAFPLMYGGTATG